MALKVQYASSKRSASRADRVDTKSDRSCLRYAGVSRIVAFSFTLVAMAAVSVAVFSTPVHAQETPDCGDATCRGEIPEEWGGGVEKSLLLGATGGSITDESNRVQIDFDAEAGEPVDIRYNSLQAPSVALNAGQIGLGAFRLNAMNAGASAGAGESVTETVGESGDGTITWRMHFTYPDCAVGEPCMDNLYDETSVTCVRLDASTGGWVRVESRVNVFTNRLECACATLGEFAIVANPLQTSGITDSRSYLPLVGGW